MNRIDARFAERAGHPALIPYLTAGDPSLEALVPTLHALVDGGADLIEVGIPFSDPMADGPVIQAACDRALARGVNIDRVLEALTGFRRVDHRTPLVLMGYVNPIEQYGHARFAAAAAQAGADGVLVVDASSDPMDPLSIALEAHQLRQIRLIAPTTRPDRAAQLAATASGFLYYVSLRGVTGAGHLAVDEAKLQVYALRQHSTLPVAVGFGVRDAATAAQIGRFADAVVVGSALVERLAAASDVASAESIARAFMIELRAGLLARAA